MNLDGYTVNSLELARYVVAKHFPERTDRETAVILAFVAAHGDEFDTWTFAKRVGQGLAPNPEHLPAVQQNTAFSTKKRIDMLAWSGPQPTIIEVKERVTPASLGQILTYRQFFLEENPDAQEPALVVIGRYSDEDTIRALTRHGVTVYLYPLEDAGGVAAAGGV